MWSVLVLCLCLLWTTFEVLCDKIPDLLASSSALKFFCSLLDLELDLSCFYGLLPLPGDVSLIMDV